MPGREAASLEILPSGRHRCTAHKPLFPNSSKPGPVVVGREPLGRHRHADAGCRRLGPAGRSSFRCPRPRQTQDGPAGAVELAEILDVVERDRRPSTSRAWRQPCDARSDAAPNTAASRHGRTTARTDRGPATSAGWGRSAGCAARADKPPAPGPSACRDGPLRLLHGIHAQRADRIDRQEIELFVCHALPLVLPSSPASLARRRRFAPTEGSWASMVLMTPPPPAGHLPIAKGDGEAFIYACFSRCPPNAKRIADSTLLAKSASPRELNRSIERRRQHVGRHRLVDGGLDRPAALAGVGDAAAELAQAGSFAAPAPSGRAATTRSRCRAARPRRCRGG